MRPGDFIVTPSMMYHDHGNPGETPTIWMDGLDVPIVNLFSSSFAEHYGEDVQPVTKKEAGAVFHFPYERSRAALDKMSAGGPPDPHHGFKMQYTNPSTGGSPMPTIGSFLQWLP